MLAYTNHPLPGTANVYKDINNLAKFKDDIKGWVPDCICRLCKTYIAGVGFTE